MWPTSTAPSSTSRTSADSNTSRRRVTGWPDTLELPRGEALPHLKQSSSDDYRQHYTPTTRALVAATFRRDFELFGYPLDED